MSTTAVVVNYVKYSGDLNQEFVFDSGELLDSPAMTALVELAVGNNTVTLPDVTDFTVRGLVIVPPDGNVVEPTLKGVNGDTGIALSAERASVIQFGETLPASIVLNVAAEAVFRLIWF